MAGTPADTLGVQSVAVCAEVSGALVDGPAAEDGVLWADLWPLPPTSTRVTTNAAVSSTATTVAITHAFFEPGGRGGGPGGYGPVGHPPWANCGGG
ncbi:hypothetical protein E2F47_21975 [Mycobacterium eburneum]|nr:hypothetical protein E2F47_21975 [Mycobacterium eburneum]